MFTFSNKDGENMKKLIIKKRPTPKFLPVPAVVQARMSDL